MNPLRPSNMNRAALCPPAPWREMHSAITEPSPDANEGKLLHAAIAAMMATGEIPFGLTEEQLSVVKACVNMRLRFPVGDAGPILEKTIPMLDSDGAPILERDVTPDCVELLGDAIRVFDWKTGRLEPDFPATMDLQMQCYAIATRNFYRMEGKAVHAVTAIRFHPRLWDEHRSAMVHIEGNAEDWRTLEDKIKGVVAKSMPNAEAQPGEAQCRYCRAKVQCKEFQQWCAQFIVNVDWNTLPVPVLAQVYKRLVEIQGPLKNAVETAKEALLTLSEEELAQHGLKLQNTGAVRSIPNVFEARERWEKHYPKLAFESCLSVSVSELQKVFQAQSGCKKSCAADLLDEFFDGLIEKKEKAKSLKVVK